MKKVRFLCLTVLTMGLLTGCQRFSPDGTAVTIRSNGKIQSVVKESFDKEYYSEEELQAEIENAVSQYNTNAGAENVEQKGFSVEDQVATLEIDYATGEDYANFNNVTFFTGDVLTAYYDAGYDFQATFQSVEKGTVVSSAVTREEVLNSYNYDILILEEPIEVKVPGNIVYASTNVEITGKNTARVVSSDAETAETESETETESISESGEVQTVALEPMTEETGEEESIQLAYILYN